MRALVLGLVAGLTGARAQAAPAVAVYVGADCARCRVAQRVLRTAGVPFELRAIERPEHRAAAQAALGPEAARRLPALRIGSRWLPDDPDWEVVRAALPAPPPPWRPARGAEPRVQWFAQGESPGCEVQAQALVRAGVALERADLRDPAVAERMWVSARLLGLRARAGLTLPLVLIDDAVLTGCPAWGDLAVRLGHADLWVAAEAALLETPAEAAEAVLGAINFARILPRRYRRLQGAALPEDGPLAGQLGLARSLEPHLALAAPTETLPDFEWRSAPSAQEAVGRLLAEDPMARQVLLDPAPARVAVALAPDPLGGLRLRLWVRPAALAEPAPGAAGSVFRPRPPPGP